MVGERHLEFRFRAAKSPQCQAYSLGEFVEGLWNEDVAELFLAGPGNSYQELNFSPTGAWWSALFSGYRKLDRACPELQPELEVVSGEGFWQVQCHLALASLVPWREAPRLSWRLHVASILFPEDPEYLCSGHHQGGTPDFHLRGNFHPL